MFLNKSVRKNMCVEPLEGRGRGEIGVLETVKQTNKQTDEQNKHKRKKDRKKEERKQRRKEEAIKDKTK